MNSAGLKEFLNHFYLVKNCLDIFENDFWITFFDDINLFCKKWAQFLSTLHPTIKKKSKLSFH